MMKLICRRVAGLALLLLLVPRPGQGRVLTWQTFQSFTADDSGLPAIPNELLGSESNVVENDDDVIEASLENIVGGCSGGECHFCTHSKYFRVCLDAEVVSDGIEVDVSFDGHKIFSTHFSVANPKPICLNNVPFLKHISDLCLVIYDVNLSTKSACVKITFKVNLIVHKKISVKIACFHLPRVADETQQLPDQERQGLSVSKEKQGLSVSKERQGISVSKQGDGLEATSVPDKTDALKRFLQRVLRETWQLQHAATGEVQSTLTE